MSVCHPFLLSTSFSLFQVGQAVLLLQQLACFCTLQDSFLLFLLGSSPPVLLPHKQLMHCNNKKKFFK